MARIVGDLDPTLSALVPLSTKRTTAIDLSNAQNEVIHPELLDVFKITIENETITDVSIGMMTHNQALDQHQKAFALPTAPGGEPQAREILSDFFNQYFKPVHPVKAEHVVLTAGASDAIEHVVQAVCNDGNSIIVPGPYWRK